MFKKLSRFLWVLVAVGNVVWRVHAGEVEDAGANFLNLAEGAAGDSVDADIVATIKANTEAMVPAAMKYVANEVATGTTSLGEAVGNAAPSLTSAATGLSTSGIKIIMSSSGLLTSDVTSAMSSGVTQVVSDLSNKNSAEVANLLTSAASSGISNASSLLQALKEIGTTTPVGQRLSQNIANNMAVAGSAGALNQGMANSINAVAPALTQAIDAAVTASNSIGLASAIQEIPGEVTNAISGLTKQIEQNSSIITNRLSNLDSFAGMETADIQTMVNTVDAQALAGMPLTAKSINELAGAGQVGAFFGKIVDGGVPLSKLPVKAYSFASMTDSDVGNLVLAMSKDPTGNLATAFDWSTMTQQQFNNGILDNLTGNLNSLSRTFWNNVVHSNPQALGTLFNKAFSNSAYAVLKNSAVLNTLQGAVKSISDSDFNAFIGSNSALSRQAAIAMALMQDTDFGALSSTKLLSLMNNFNSADAAAVISLNTFMPTTFFQKILTKIVSWLNPSSLMQNVFRSTQKFVIIQKVLLDSPGLNTGFLTAFTRNLDLFDLVDQYNLFNQDSILVNSQLVDGQLVGGQYHTFLSLDSIVYDKTFSAVEWGMDADSVIARAKKAAYFTSNPSGPDLSTMLHVISDSKPSIEQLLSDSKAIFGKKEAYTLKNVTALRGEDDSYEGYYAQANLNNANIGGTYNSMSFLYMKPFVTLKNISGVYESALMKSVDQFLVKETKEITLFNKTFTIPSGAIIARANQFLVLAIRTVATLGTAASIGYSAYVVANQID